MARPSQQTQLKASCLSHIFQNGSVTKPELAEAMKVSIPTVSSIVSELEKDGIIQYTGLSESTGGRRAIRISVVADFRISIGIAIHQHHIRICAMNLCAEPIAEVRQDLIFENSTVYCTTICNCVLRFCMEHHLNLERILCASFAIVGLVDVNGEKVLHGTAIGSGGFTAEGLRELLPFPCRLCHDVEASAYDMLSFHPQISDAFYLFLDDYVGGALIQNGQVAHNDSAPCGMIEHMILHPNGRKCYCGKSGCVHMYVSTAALLSKADNIDFLDRFWSQLRSDPSGATLMDQGYQEYLSDLSVVIYNLTMLYSIPIVLGGQIGCQLQPNDISFLQERCRKDSNILITTPQILVHDKKSTVASGAALLVIHQYLNTLFHR